MYIRRRGARPIFLRFPPRLPRKTRRKLAVFLLCGCLTAGLITSLAYLRRLSAEMALSDAIDIVTLLISESVNREMRTGDMSYDRFVSLEKDENGLVTAVKTNMAEINELSTRLLTDIVGEGERRVIEVDIPLGNLIGSSILMGKGPDVPLDVIMLTSSRIEFRNDLTEAGINQTKHRIIFNIVVDIDVLVPWDLVSYTVESEIIVAETVIVGTVPKTYIKME